VAELLRAWETLVTFKKGTPVSARQGSGEMNQGALKKMAATRRVEYVKDGQIVGLGTGSTLRYVVAKLGERVKKGCASARGHIAPRPRAWRTEAGSRCWPMMPSGGWTWPWTERTRWTPG